LDLPYFLRPIDAAIASAASLDLPVFCIFLDNALNLAPDPNLAYGIFIL